MPAVSAQNAFRFFGERYRLPDPKGAEGGKAWGECPAPLIRHAAFAARHLPREGEGFFVLITPSP